MTSSEAIKIRFKNLMKEKGFKQADFVNLGGVPRATVSQILNGTRERASITSIYAMCAAMGISLKEFFNDPIFDEVND